MFIAFLAREDGPEGAGGKPLVGCVAAGGIVIAVLAASLAEEIVD